MIYLRHTRVFEFLFYIVVGEVVAVDKSVDAEAGGVPTVMHVRCPDRLREDVYRQVLELLADLSPVVQALPPTAALVELKGALRYHGSEVQRLGEMLRVRILTRLGVDVRVGIGPSITIAATASAQLDPPGGVLTVPPAHAADWLAPLPVEALHGIGPKQSAALHDYGVHTVGLLAAISSETVQRLLGGKAGRLAPTGPAASTPARSSPAPCPRPPPSACASKATSWTAHTSAPPSSTWSSSSHGCCADAARQPAPCR